MRADDWSSRRLHFVGVGGAGMSGLALVADALGATVTGSDRVDTPYLAAGREAGSEPMIGYRAANVPVDAEVVYSSATGPDNAERGIAARELHRADLLAEIAALPRCLAVTGPHGKTAPPGMVRHALRGAGMDPGYV